MKSYDPTYLILIMAIIAQLGFMWYNIIKYKRLLDEKNVKLIQFYLDMKFLWKGVLDSLSIPDSTRFCIKLIDDMKEYYNLEDIIVIDSIRMLDKENNTALRSKVIHYIVHNIGKIEQRLKSQKFVKNKVKIDDMQLVLHISLIAPQAINDGLVVCVEKYPSLLSEHELISLETSVNLLKTRLLYD